MEQPESNPTFCTNNCGFYGSSQFEGMCSKCYRDHVSRSLNTGRPDSFNSYYASSTSAVPSSSQVEFSSTSTSDVPVQPPAMRDDEDEMIGRMDEDNLLPPANPDNATVNKMDDDDENSESPLPIDESSTTTKPDLVSPPEESSPSLLTRVGPTSTLPMTISRSIDIPVKNDSNISLSVMETSSLADSMSPLTASSVDKKKRTRCTWPTCNKKLGLTGFDCRCGGQFCPLHRYANEHNCTFDYKEHGQNEIRKNMPVVQADRVRRI